METNNVIDLDEIVEMINDILVDMPFIDGYAHITDKKILNKLEYELRERIVILQEQLTAIIPRREEIVQLCKKRGIKVNLSQSKPDSWGLHVYYLHTNKGSFMFG